MEKKLKINKSASRTIEILEYLSTCQYAPNLTEISQALDIPKSSCFEIIQTLVDFQAIMVADEFQKTYRVGIKIFQIGSSLLAQNALYSVARNEITELSKELNETVYLAIQKHGKIIYIDKVEGNQAIRSTCVIGSTNYMHITGLGKALLACYSQEKVDEIVEYHPLIAKTKFSITDKDVLMKDLAEIRKRGYSIDNKESMVLVRCVAAPIFGADNNPVAAISITTLADHSDDEYLKKLGQDIIETALKISKSIGYLKEVLFS